VTVEAGAGPQAWKDYLKIRYRLDVLNEPRALVVADMLADSLKRAPHTMARHYKQIADAGLRDLISRFNTHRVPAVLFDYQSFTYKYKGADSDAVISGLAAETEFFKLPQTIHLASCAAFFSDMRQICEEDHCLIAHTFEEGSYSDAQQVIWLAADIKSKLEVDVEVARAWCDRLENMAERLASAHLFIGRAGASTIAELTAVGRPAILIPLPYAMDDHQSANAREMAAEGGARVIRQPPITTEEPDRYTGDKRNALLKEQAEIHQRMAKDLCLQIQAIAQHPQTLANAAHAAWNCGYPNAASDLADLVESFGAAPLMDVIRVAGAPVAPAGGKEALALEGVE